VPDFAEQLVMSEAPVLEQPAPAPEPQPAAPAPEPASDGRPRNADGTFAPKVKDEGSETGVKQEAAPPQQAAQLQPEPPTGDEGKHVPLAALNALKQKLADVERERDSLRQPKAPEQSQQVQPQTPNPSQASTPTGPDFSFDESQFEDDPQALFEARIHKNKMDMSTVVAAQQFGEGVLNEAWAAFDAACKTDPQVNAWSFSPELRNSAHPMGKIVQWFKQSQEVKQLTEAGGLEKLRESIRAQLLAESQGQPPAAPVVGGAPAPSVVAMPKPAATALPPSLARGGAGSQNAPERPSDNEVFEQMFDKSKRLSRKR
jgi:hypothetical protein